MHQFDEWFARVCPGQPQEKKDAALLGWNAAVRAAQEVLDQAKDRLVHEREYQMAALVRDLREELAAVARTRD